VAPRAIFVFDRENWCSVFRDSEQAAAHLETADVETDEYVALDDSGTVFRVWAEGFTVRIEETPERDEAQLHARLQRFVDKWKIDAPSDDVIAIGNAILRDSWDGRWPKRPRWLAERMHGAGPPQI
jgi:hypothetical protein